MTDPIADMIIRMKNAAMANKDVVSMPMSKLKLAIAEKLKTRGFLSDVTSRGKNVTKTLEVTLARTSEGTHRLTDVKRVSKPGMRVYTGSSEIQRVRGGMGVVVVSTPKGVLFGDEARKEKVGGEVLFEIW
ncbi:MAG: 30S ribosomal protein S8 [Candidatus Pacebacteria bacterium]|nr:30S ribosomal protein S8 [Candidatus Paceibacterota bacterium]